MNAREKLLDEIEAFLEANTLAAAKLGHDAMGDSAFVLRLRRGRNIGIDTADKIREYMRSYKPRREKQRRPRKAAPILALAS